MLSFVQTEQYNESHVPITQSYQSKASLDSSLPIPSRTLSSDPQPSMQQVLHKVTCRLLGAAARLSSRAHKLLRANSEFPTAHCRALQSFRGGRRGERGPPHAPISLPPSVSHTHFRSPAPPLALRHTLSRFLFHMYASSQMQTVLFSFSHCCPPKHTARLPVPRTPTRPGPAVHSDLSPCLPHSFGLSILDFPPWTFCTSSSL